MGVEAKNSKRGGEREGEWRESGLREEEEEKRRR